MQRVGVGPLSAPGRSQVRDIAVQSLSVAGAPSVHAIVTGRSFADGQQTGMLVIADGDDLDASLLRQIANAEGYAHIDPIATIDFSIVA